jgi:tagatose-1,6-bisphosphate aldolase non-catalytic subunit AgaZ/GatZ
MSNSPPEQDWGIAVRSPEDAARLRENVDYRWRFFAGESEAQKAAEKIVAILEAEKIPYAIIGALALNQYGHRRVTVLSPTAPRAWAAAARAAGRSSLPRRACR